MEQQRQFGAAVEFQGEIGTGDRIEVPEADELSLEEWTITAWVKLQTPDHGDWAIIAVKDPANGFQNYALDLNPQGNIVSEVTSNGAWSDTVSTTSVYDDEWHFVAASYDGDTLRAFVDGSLEAEQDFGPGDLNDAPLSIGDRLDGSQPILGLVDDLGLFRAALAEEELSILMDQGLGMVLSLGQITGDFNGNGELDAADLDLLAAQQVLANPDLSFDLNGDSAVGFDDRAMWVNDLKNTWFGDANLDGEFNSSDFVAVFQAGLFETQQPATWAQGDWNGDGTFGSGDFVTAFQDGGFEQGPMPTQAVPEPSSLALLLVGIVASCFRVRRR